MVTSWPARRHSDAAVIPAGPDPTTATRLPVAGAVSGTSTPFSLSQSATNRSRAPMRTGLSFFPSIQVPWHCASCGQTRPHMAGSILSCLIIRAAFLKSSFAIALMKPGISIDTGHPFTQSGRGHPMHRSASNTAVCSGRPVATSLKS